MLKSFFQSLGSLSPYRDGPLSRTVREHRVLFFLVVFGLISALSVLLSFMLRFEWSWLRDDPRWHAWRWQMLAVAVPVRLTLFYVFGMHKVSWRFASMRDLPPLIYATLIGSLIITAGLYLPHQASIRAPC